MLPQQGLRSLQDLAPEMRLAMASDLEDEEGADGEMTGDEVFDSEAGTSVNTTPAATPLPPIDTLVQQTAIFVEPQPKAEKEEVITEQVKCLEEELRPGSELAGVTVVTEQPMRSEPLPIIRCVSLFSLRRRRRGGPKESYHFVPVRVDSICDLPLPPPPEMSPLPEETGGAVVGEPAVEASTTEPEAGYSHEDVVESAAAADRCETTIRSSRPQCRILSTPPTLTS